MCLKIIGKIIGYNGKIKKDMVTESKNLSLNFVSKNSCTYKAPKNIAMKQ